MAVWYIDSVQYAAITAWATGATIAAGALRRPSAPATNNERVVVAIVAGTTHATTEPTWTTTKGAKNTDNTVTWQECTGQAGVCGDLTNCTNWTAVKNTAVALGKVIQNNAGTYLFICSTAGTAGNGSEPSWTLTAGVTTSDSTITWTCIGVVGNFTAYKAPHARLLNGFTATWGAAGDTFYVGDDHAETQASAMVLTSPSTASAQCLILCVDHTKSPPASADLKTTATITTTGASNLTVQAGGYYYGIAFQCGSGAVNALLSVSPLAVTMKFDNCSLQKLGTTATVSAIGLGSNSPANSGLIKLLNTTFKVGATGDSIRMAGGRVEWNDTSSPITGSTIPLFLFNTSGGGLTGVILICERVDFSGLGSNTIFGSGAGVIYAKLITCKLASSYAIGTTVSSGSIIDIINSDGGATNYKHSRLCLEGSHVVSTIAVRTNGATDGVTPISWMILSTANALWTAPFDCMPALIWNSTLSTNRVVTVFGIMNAAALPNNDQIWISVSYLGSASSPIGSRISSTKADVLAAGGAVSADTSAWDSAAATRANTTAYTLGNIIKLASNPGRIFICTSAGTSAGSEPGGYSSAVDGGAVTDSGATFRAGVRFSMSVTLSSPQPALAGLISATVKVGVASSTFWVDPLIILG